MSRLMRNSELLLFLVCIGAGVWIIWWQNHRLDSGAAATLVGALFGGAALLLGNWINRRNDAARSLKGLSDRRESLKAMITPELINVAAGLLGSERLIRVALRTLRDGGPAVDTSDLASIRPREMPFTSSLGAKLLDLDKQALDALVTLRSNLALTMLTVEDLPQPRLTLLSLQLLANLYSHDMEVLAQCFEQIAPGQKTAYSSSDPEFVFTILRRHAASLHGL